MRIESKSSRAAFVHGDATSLLEHLRARPQARLLVGVCGYALTGKSALLEEAEAVYRAAGIDVHRTVPAADLPRLDDAAIIIDDANLLDDVELQRIHTLITEREASAIVAYGSWPQPPALRRIVVALERHRAPVVLGPLSRTELAYGMTRMLGKAPGAEMLDAVMTLTGGIPWLVEAAAEGLRDQPDQVAADAATPHLLARLTTALAAQDPSLMELLLAIAVGFDARGQLPPGLLDEDVSVLAERARHQGFLLPDGTLIPCVRQSLLRSTPAYRVHALQHEMVDSLIGGNARLEEVVDALTFTGTRDSRLAQALEQEGDRCLAGDPARALMLYEKAEAAGTRRLVTARRAQAALAAGHFEQASQMVDELLEFADPTDPVRTIDVAASIWARRGMMAQSAALYRTLEPAILGASAHSARIAMIGTGDLPGAAALHSDVQPFTGPINIAVSDTATPSTTAPPVSATPPGNASPGTTVPPTLTNSALALMADGLSDSVTNGGAHSLTNLVRASDVMTAAGSRLALIELPAVAAALVALNTGETSLAASLLDDALTGQQCGPSASPRLQLMRAWVAMQTGALDVAHRLVTEAGSAVTFLTPRDRLLLHTVQVGLARRTDDAPRLLDSWRAAQDSIMHVAVDLFDLFLIAELHIVGSRLHDTTRVAPFLAEAWALLDRLGNPPLWTMRLHWACVQAAILSGRPEELAPHAAALVRAAEHHRVAAVFAAAGKEWVNVLAGEFDTASVEHAARALADIGLPWDGSRLAGHAAGHAADRKDMARLLEVARHLRAGRPYTDTAPITVIEPDAAPPNGSPYAGRGEAPLSARELEVARLVLQGKTYLEIGEAIFISPRTVEHHVARMRRRLGAESRSELLTALRRALGPEDPTSGFP